MDLHSNSLRIEKILKTALLGRMTGKANWLEQLTKAFMNDCGNKILVTLWQRKADHMRAPQEVKALLYQ